ncbi:MAG: hypothetical protein R3B96_20550 [Pirellulaceae bacterium]
MSAAGYAGPAFDPRQVALELCGQTIFHDGQPTESDAAALSQTMSSSKEVSVVLSVGSGPGRGVLDERPDGRLRHFQFRLHHLVVAPNRLEQPRRIGSSVTGARAAA